MSGRRKQQAQQPRPQQQAHEGWREREWLFKSAQQCAVRLDEMQGTLDNVVHRLATAERVAAEAAGKVEKLEALLASYRLCHEGHAGDAAEAPRQPAASSSSSSANAVAVGERVGGSTERYFIGSDTDDECASVGAHIALAGEARRLRWSDDLDGQDLAQEPPAAAEPAKEIETDEAAEIATVKDASADSTNVVSGIANETTSASTCADDEDKRDNVDIEAMRRAVCALEKSNVDGALTLLSAATGVAVSTNRQKARRGWRSTAVLGDGRERTFTRFAETEADAVIAAQRDACYALIMEVRARALQRTQSVAERPSSHKR